jgi:DNA-binding beta-propeller fold protein YncE
MNYGDYPPNIGTLITNNCTTSGCHNSSSYLAAAGYNLDTWKKMFSGSTNGSPVIPYSSTFSSLCYFINTYPDLGLQNAPVMPYNGKILSHSDVKMIKDWIDNGAPDINGNVMWADNSKRKKLYAVNQGCDVVTVFDSETQLPMRFIKVGTKLKDNTPHYLKVSPDGNYWYVVFINNNIMQKFRCSDDSHVGDIPLTPLAANTGTDDIQEWNTFVITKDGKKAYCAALDPNGRVSSVDLENMKFIAMSGLLSNPHGIALNEAENKLYVATQYGNFIQELDTAFMSANTYILDNSSSPTTSSLSINPHDMILSPDSNNLVITCQHSNDVRIFNLASKKITDIIPTGVFPQEIVYSKSANQYFVTCTEDNVTFPNTDGVLTRINAGDYSTTNIPCGYQPHGIAVDETKKLIYVLSRNISSNGPLPHHTSECKGRNGFVNFVDLNTFTVLPKRYELSSDPYFIFARP